MKSIRHVKDVGMLVNGGFFILRQQIFDYLREGEELVEEPFQRLAAEGKLLTYPLRRILGLHGHVQGAPAPGRHVLPRAPAMGGLEKRAEDRQGPVDVSRATAGKPVETLRELVENDLTHLAAALREEFGAMEGSNLLVTGGAGFLGYYLVQSVLFWNQRHAAGRPIHVTVVDNYQRGAPEWILDAARESATWRWWSTISGGRSRPGCASSSS